MRAGHDKRFPTRFMGIFLPSLHVKIVKGSLKLRPASTTSIDATVT